MNERKTIFEVTYRHDNDASLTCIGVRRFKTRREAEAFAGDAPSSVVHEATVTRDMAKRYGL